VLDKLQKQHQFDIFIHPVVPVLNETRQVVLKFNEILQFKISNEKKSFHWLDFLPDLLTNNLQDLNSSYELDGTHLNPSYLYLLEREMNKY
jgi:hypothetical protein